MSHHDTAPPAADDDDGYMLPLFGEGAGCVGAHCAPLHDAPAARPAPAPSPPPGGCACHHDA